MSKMRELVKTVDSCWEAIAGIWGINGVTFAVLRLSDVRDLVAIVLGLVSIASTLLILEVNRRKLTKSDKPNENP